jgi:hypothetical protein
VSSLKSLHPSVGKLLSVRMNICLYSFLATFQIFKDFLCAVNFFYNLSSLKSLHPSVGRLLSVRTNICLFSFLAVFQIFRDSLCTVSITGGSFAW